MSGLSVHEAKKLAEPLRDPVFQDWMVAVSLIVLSEETDHVVNDFLVQMMQSGKGFKVPELRFLRLLEENNGHIVPQEDIINHVLKNDAERADDATEWIAIRQIGLRLQKKFDQPLYYAEYLGWGLDIDKLHVSAFSLPILYELWKQQGKPIHEEELALKLYRDSDDETLTSLGQQIELLSSTQLTPSDYRVQTESLENGEQTYALWCDRNDGRTRETHSDEMSMEFAFQQWLVDVGLLIRSDEIFTPTVRLDDRTKEFDLLTLLRIVNGFLLPYSYLSDRLYRSPQAMKKIGRMVTELKKKGAVGKEEVYALPGYGVGIGIEKVNVTTKQIALLKILWDGEPHTAADLFEKIWGVSGSTTTLERTKLYVLLNTTRIALRHSGYDIVSIGGEDTKQFLLRKIQ